MLFAIALLTTADGNLRAIAPDLASCDLTGATEQELLPKLRLAIEGELTRLLLAGADLPDTRQGEPSPVFAPAGTFQGPDVPVVPDVPGVPTPAFQSVSLFSAH